MTIATGTFLTYSTVGIREDLSNIIYNIAPIQTPFMNGIGKGKIKNTLFEWQRDTLAAAAANAQLEGDDIATFTAVTATTRPTNRAQISRKEGIISGTDRAVNTAGREDEYDMQIAKRSKELKRDMEFAVTQNTTAVAGNSTTARQTRGLEGWVATNNSLGATGAAPNPTNNTAPTDGTQRAFTESQLKSVLQLCFETGGEPDTIMVGSFNKQVLSTFTGNATRMDKSEDKKLVTSIDIYVSDFGELKVVPNRFQRGRTAFVLQMDMWELDYLRPFQTVELAKTGDADKFMLLTEFGLRSKEEGASGAVRDLTTS